MSTAEQQARTGPSAGPTTAVPAKPSGSTTLPGAGAGPRTPRTPRPGPRKVRLSVSKVDPWSVMKLAFLLSVAVGIGIVVATIALWTVLDEMGVFTDINRVIQDVAGAESGISIDDYVGFGRVVSLATVVAVADVVLLTALATLGAFLYNIGSSLVGGLHLTLSDD